jgi:hypothetical protein
LPIASIRAVMPARVIHALTSALARACSGVRNIRVSFPGSALIAASSSRRARISGASAIIPAVLPSPDRR